MIRTIALALMIGLSTLVSLAPADQPNIVLVMADDQGWGDMAYHGHPDLKTPNFDESARTGLKFNRFYAAAPVCSPTRASVLTGRHPNRMGVFKWGYPMRPQEETLAEVFQAHGYKTAHFGKWHLGSLRHDSKANPAQNGFTHWISAPNFFDNHPVLCDNGTARQYQGESSVLTAQLTNQWIQQQSKSDSPFLAVVWFGSPHSPHRAIEDDYQRYEELYADQPDKLRKRKINFLGEVSGMDRAYGMIRDQLRSLNLEDNTIVWYTSDNGALRDVGSAGKFRGHKGQIYEGGLRVPAIVHWPDKIKAPAEIDQRCSTCDIFPTLLQAAGIDHQFRHPIDGISLASTMDAKHQPSEKLTETRRMGFWDYTTGGRGVRADLLMKEMLEAQANGNQVSAPEHDVHADKIPEKGLSLDSFPGHSAWIDGHWKLHRVEGKKGIRHELYDLDSDPYEANNVLDQHPDRVQSMKLDLKQWLRSVAESYNGADYK